MNAAVWFSSLAGLAVLAATQAEAQPSRVIILRHAEKLNAYALCDLGRERADGLVVAEDRPAHGLIGIGDRLQVVEHDVVRRVARLSDFLQHNLTFALEFDLFECRRGENVGEDVERERHVRFQHARMKRGLLSARVRVEISTDRFDLFCDRARAAPLRAFERHVFEHVRHAHEVANLIARTGVHPHTERRTLELRHRVGNDG